jgi:DNA-binding LacI/PurR family transcriptional regulator
LFFVDLFSHLLTITRLLALNYLYTKGYKRIGYCIRRRNGANSKQRELAYRDFVKKHNEPFNPDYIFDECLHFEDGEKVIERIKKIKNPPSALLVTADQV